jgi:hypothetical protein
MLELISEKRLLMNVNVLLEAECDGFSLMYVRPQDISNPFMSDDIGEIST